LSLINNRSNSSKLVIVHDRAAGVLSDLCLRFQCAFEFNARGLDNLTVDRAAPEARLRKRERETERERERGRERKREPNSSFVCHDDDDNARDVLSSNPWH
jgi:hypothetical protein